MVVENKINITEEKIRPQKLFDEFLRLAKKDTYKFFKKVRFFRIKCPACLSEKTNFAFKKDGFSYEVCSQCETLFVNPRPKPKIFDRYYREGKSIKYLSNCLYKKTEASRRKMVHQPKIQLVNQLIPKFYRTQKGIALVDIGAGYGTFCSEFVKNYKGSVNIYPIEPSPYLAKACRDKGIEVINKPLEEVTASDLDGKYKKIFTCFELIEHLSDLERFFTTCRKLLKRKEILVLTTLNGLGFDIQLLWSKSKAVFSPHHLNFFNPNSAIMLMQRHGFRIAEVSTPGRLDVDIVTKSVDLLGENRFWSYFLQRLGPRGRDELQKFLQRFNLSSHMVIVAQKI